MARRQEVRVDPDVPNWLLTKRGGFVLPVLTILSALIVLSSIVASLVVVGGRVNIVGGIVIVAAIGAVVWAVVDLAWWTRGGRRAIVRLPRDPDA
ncbi:hypothetical protein ACPEEZ_03140 [Frigoribacterium sp. 2-23]|uniref:hypothetical protein n=1 Tax=Frigoribacterium sp. 2-23 TaxID=3415006 RepID=UPI003C6FD1AA